MNVIKSGAVKRIVCELFGFAGLTFIATPYCRIDLMRWVCGRTGSFGLRRAVAPAGYLLGR